MTAETAFLHSFRPLEFGYRLRQTWGLTWLIEALERTGAGERAAAALELYRQFQTSDHVQWRRTCLEDYTHKRWEDMRLFSQEWGGDWTSPPLEKRMEIFRATAETAALGGFAEEEPAPDTLVQVSCTGYDSPTAAQKLISRRGWGERTKSLHLGHMGCYAALPAARLAAELARGGEAVSVFLIELCSLHLRPGGSELQQVVMNTLFADGAIRFDVSREKKGRAFEFVAHRECVLPGSEGEMTWSLKDSAFGMTLSRAVPIHVARSISAFVRELLRRAELKVEDVPIFAIHPGGPKIIDLIADRLELSPEKVRHSRNVFRERGNMSSCTVPHVWDEILKDPTVPNGAFVVSLAFGPGLTVVGNLLRKEGE